jgi:NAD+ diphosphatase
MAFAILRSQETPLNVISFYLHCPKCGELQQTLTQGNKFACENDKCKFQRFFNPATGVAVFVTRPDGKMLFIMRAKEPSKGKLGLPGGFVDFDESAENAARREVREEVDLHIDALTFVCTHPNSYTYGGVTYPVLDLFFASTLAVNMVGTAMNEVQEVRWIDPKGVNPEDLAFPSMQAAFRTWASSWRKT